MARTATRRAALAAAGAALVAVPVGGWYVASAATAARVTVDTHVAWCRDTVLRTERVAGEDGRNDRVEILTVTPSTRCVVQVRVRNDGTFPVHLERAAAPLLGPSGGAVLRGRVQVPGQPGQIDDPADDDASSLLDRDLSAGRSTGFRIVLEFRDDGCTAGRTIMRDWALVRFSSLGRTVTASGEQALAFRSRGGQNPGCEDLAPGRP